MSRHRSTAYLLAFVGVVVLGILVGAVVAFSAPAAAQNDTLNETAPYYNNSTTTGNYTEWLPENVTLDSLGSIVTRIGPYVIGTGDQIPGGNIYAGTVFTGLVMVAIFIGAAAATNVGAASGVVVASVAGYGLVELGFAPGWLRIVLLLVIGVVAAVAAYRTTS